MCLTKVQDMVTLKIIDYLQIQEGSSRPNIIDNGRLKEVIEYDPSKSTRELSYNLKYS